MSPTVLVLAIILAAPTPTPTPDPKLAELVRKLGDKSFRTREDAARELLRRGPAAVSVLTDGTRDTDPEVSERCRQLLPQAAALERNEKLAALLKDPAAPPPKGLAGLERFLKITGDSKPAREMYAELLGIHFQTLEVADTDPEKAAKEYRQFCDDAYNRWQASVRTGRYSYDNMFATRADISYFLFLSADTRVRKFDNGANRSSILLNGTQITKAMAEGEGAEPMKKLFLDWLEHEPMAHLQQRGFQMAATSNIKEALPLVLKLLAKDGQQPFNKAQVMLALAKLGTKDQLPALEPMMADKTVVTTVNFGNGGPMTIQVRDVAMGVSAQMCGQKLTDFGFDSRFGNATNLSYIYYGFKDDKDRDAGHAKWKEWTEKNLKK